MKINKALAATILILGFFLWTNSFEKIYAASASPAFTGKPVKLAHLSKESKDCIECHAETHPGIVQPWKGSAHAANNVGCYECHQTDASNPAAIKHEGVTISVIVSPKACARCHKEETDQMTQSYHAKANQFTGSLDNVLGRLVTGEGNFDLACAQCHGSDVVVESGGKLQVGPWPNTGIGRKNPDGSLGACIACHQRHSFDLKQVREPDTCGKCHQGPDHPQIEIYELSKHGIAYKVHKEEMNMGKKDWILGKDYTQAPVCSTCHMGGTRTLARTHDVGARIKWTLRPPISKVLPDGEKKRADMKKVCLECHSSNWVNGFFTQFDRYVELYNEKFAIPATTIMKFMKDEKLVDDTPFNEKIEIDYYELWHHQGRRGRHGAAMMSPDYAQWHGMYEVALSFYFKLLPDADELVTAKNDPKLTERWNKLKSSIMDSVDHKWKQGLPPEELHKIVEYYKKRYGKEGGQ